MIPGAEAWFRQPCERCKQWCQPSEAVPIPWEQQALPPAFLTCGNAWSRLSAGAAFMAMDGIAVSLREARAQLSRLLDAAHAGHTLVLTRYGRPWARLMPPEEPVRPRPSYGRFMVEALGSDCTVLLRQGVDPGVAAEAAPVGPLAAASTALPREPGQQPTARRLARQQQPVVVVGIPRSAARQLEPLAACAHRARVGEHGEPGAALCCGPRWAAALAPAGAAMLPGIAGRRWLSLPEHGAPPPAGRRTAGPEAWEPGGTGSVAS